MSKYVIDGETMTDIADAIRTKLGSQEEMTPLEMPDNIMAISGGGGVEFVEMTKAQYDALPDTKLTDGVPRLITDYTEGSILNVKYTVIIDELIGAGTTTAATKTIPSISRYDAILVYSGYCSSEKVEAIAPPNIIFKEDFYKQATVSGETDYAFITGYMKSERYTFFRFVDDTTLKYKNNQSTGCIQKIIGLQFEVSSGGGEIYDDYEVEIGKWNGQKLYRKVCHPTFPAKNTWGSFTVDIPNNAKIKNYYGVAYFSAGVTFNIPMYYANDTHIFINGNDSIGSNNVFGCHWNYSQTFLKCDFIVEYTKEALNE